MDNQMKNCNKSEAKAQELVSQTLMQLEAAKKTMEILRSDGNKAYESLASELEKSRARIKFLEILVTKLKDDSRYEAELKELKAENEKLKSSWGQREAELEAELRKSKYEIEELKANLMDKENELQAICEENDGLINQLENVFLNDKEVEILKARLVEKEEESCKVLEENKILRLEKMIDLEEVDKSKKKAARVGEQLEAAQAMHGEMEGELRRLKVQCDQWRKAAEAAAFMFCGDYLDDEDLLKKKNVNMLRRFGVLLKKPLK